MDLNEVKKVIENSDMVLVGIGEEFGCREYLTGLERYNEICHDLKIHGTEWMVPYVDFYFLRNYDKLLNAFASLKEMLDGKKYFINCTCMHGVIWNVGFNNENIVCPCGDFKKWTCAEPDCHSLSETPEEFFTLMDSYLSGERDFDSIWAELIDRDGVGICRNCGAFMQLNSLYAEHYNEEGYLEKWDQYKKWQMGTLNKKLVLLELGCSFLFPGVIRFPFEKVAFYNQKATHIRVHQTLFQTAEDLKKRGIGIEKNSVDFFN